MQRVGAQKEVNRWQSMAIDGNRWQLMAIVGLAMMDDSCLGSLPTWCANER